MPPIINNESPVMGFTLATLDEIVPNLEERYGVIVIVEEQLKEQLATEECSYFNDLILIALSLTYSPMITLMLFPHFHASTTVLIRGFMLSRLIQKKKREIAEKIKSVANLTQL